MHESHRFVTGPRSLLRVGLELENLILFSAACIGRCVSRLLIEQSKCWGYERGYNHIFLDNPGICGCRRRIWDGVTLDFCMHGGTFG